MRAMLALAVLVCVGCGKEEAGTHAGAEASAAKEVPPTREVASTFIGESWDEKFAGLIGETVTLAGAFWGGQDGNCKFAPGTSTRAYGRPDWILEKGGRCIIVANGMRVFGDPDLSVRAESLGRKVEITAVVTTREDGLIYLDYVSGKPLSD